MYQVGQQFPAVEVIVVYERPNEVAHIEQERSNSAECSGSSDDVEGTPE